MAGSYVNRRAAVSSPEAVSRPAGVAISRNQRDLHVAAEAVAVAVAAPFSLWLALQRSYPLPKWARILSGTIGAGTLIIDGGLLLAFLKKKRDENHG